MVQIGETPDTESGVNSSDVQRAPRIATAIGACFCCLGGCCGAVAMYYAYLAGAGTILHPSHDMLRSIGIALSGLASAIYYGRGVFPKYAQERD